MWSTKTLARPRPASPAQRATGLRGLLRARRRGHHAHIVRRTARWRSRRRLEGGSTAARCCRRSRGGHGEGDGQGGEGRGAPERRVDGEAAQTVSGDGVHRWHGCSGGRRRARRGPVALVWEGELRLAQFGKWRSSAGAHRRGADGGDARTESGVEEGLRWRKTDEEDAWAMGTKARCSGVDGRDKWCAG
jgi:hypothetical protein